ncbi:predicted protein [Pyrenophora tritici-repentis Pt-1C-BFP]|uniref:Uncharacterized protein n=1 Tax=Pyrenophora tritici-repentis (strain Pt-1C-BFP) TaxID=426418 RepID=B2W3V9_PYRTR|nr:uncharacterized protein PTRG_05159 [Pyrenophora tritici-repentis Pt-1C-BFP]EDU48066.1 predicted protein [Pyrenophora tritici-repentis Pt-1C-BFP]
MTQPFHCPDFNMLLEHNNRDNITAGNNPATVLENTIDPSLEYIPRGLPFAGYGSQNRHNQVPAPQTTDNHRPTAHEASRSMPAPPPVRNVPQSGNPRSQFLSGIPLHDYMFPQGGLINATVVDIIVIFPQWFRNPYILERFLNNGITANIQFVILTNTDTLASLQKQMRKYLDSKWTKQTHRAPYGWNTQTMSIHDFKPESMVSGGPYEAPPSIPFKDLAIGLKKLPVGSDAGDLTRALDYAMQNYKLDEHGHPVDFVFPDDIHLILDAIGRTVVTAGNADVSIIIRYHNIIREHEAVRRKKLAEDRRQTADERRQQELAVEAANQSMNQDHEHQIPTQQSSLYGYGQMDWQVPQPAPQHYQSDGEYGGMSSTGMGFHPPRTYSQDAAAAVASRLTSYGTPQTTTSLPPIPSICVFSPSDDDTSQPPPQQSWQPQDPVAAQQQIEDWVAANKTFDLNGVPQCSMHPAMLLRECADRFAADDTSDIARAARWAVALGDSDVLEWTVGDAEMIVGLLDAAANGFEGFI